MRKRLLYVSIALLCATLVAGGLLLRQNRLQKLAFIAPPDPSAWSVHAAAVTRGRATQGFPALALVKGANEVIVAAQLSGILLEMGPREGQWVAEGESPARIDTRELEDTLASLQAQREGAVADAERKAKDAHRGRDRLPAHS